MTGQRTEETFEWYSFGGINQKIDNADLWQLFAQYFVEFIQTLGGYFARSAFEYELTFFDDHVLVFGNAFCQSRQPERRIDPSSA